MVRKQVPQNRKLNKSDFQEWAKQIKDLSGGHPGSINRLINHLQTYWLIPSNANQQREIFTELVADEVIKILPELDDEFRDWVDTLSVFRRVDLPTIKSLSKGIPKLKRIPDEFSFLRQLTSLGIVFKNEDNEGGYSLAYVGKPLANKMRILFPDQYHELNLLAQAIYDSWIESALRADVSSFGKTPESIVLPYVKESIYHQFQQNLPSQGDRLDRIANWIGTYCPVLFKGLGKKSPSECAKHLAEIMWEDEEIKSQFTGYGWSKEKLLNTINLATDTNIAAEPPIEIKTTGDLLMGTVTSTPHRHIGDWLVDTLDMLRHNAQNMLIERWEKRNKGKAVTPPVFADRNISPEQLASVSSEELAETLPQEDVLQRKFNSYKDASGRLVIINEKYITNLKAQMESAQATRGEFELELTEAFSPNAKVEARKGLERSQKQFDEAAGKLADIYAYIYSE